MKDWDEKIKKDRCGCSWDEDVVNFIEKSIESMGYIKKEKPLDKYPECLWYNKFNIDYVREYYSTQLHIKVRTNFHHYISTSVCFEADINENNELIIFKELNEINKCRCNYALIKDNEVCITTNTHFEIKQDFHVGTKWKKGLERCIREAKRVRLRMLYPNDSEGDIFIKIREWR